MTESFRTTFRGNWCEVEFALHQARRGARDSWPRPGCGVQLEPDEPARIEILSIVRDPDGFRYPIEGLTLEEELDLQSDAMDWVEDTV